VTNVLTFNQEDQHLRDILRVVSDSFQLAGDYDQPERSRNHLSVFEHVGKQLSQHLFAHRIDIFIVVNDLLGQRDVIVNECVKAQLEDALRGCGRHGYVDNRVQLWFCDEFERARRKMKSRAFA